MLRPYPDLPGDEMFPDPASSRPTIVHHAEVLGDERFAAVPFLLYDPAVVESRWL